MHQLTKKGDAKLRIDIEGFPGRVPRNSPLNAYAEYERFMVADSKTGYELKEISGYSGEFQLLQFLSITNISYSIS